MNRGFRRPAAPLAAALVAAVLVVFGVVGCVAVGPQPEDAIPPALLASDLDIVEAEAGTSTSGFSVSIWASFVVERDAVTAAELREVLRIVVDNTHITNIEEISIIGQSDELESFEGSEHNAYLDLVPAAEELGLPDPDDGLGTVRVDCDDVIAMLAETG